MGNMELTPFALRWGLRDLREEIDRRRKTAQTQRELVELLDDIMKELDRLTWTEPEPNPA